MSEHGKLHRDELVYITYNNNSMENCQVQGEMFPGHFYTAADVNNAHKTTFDVSSSLLFCRSYIYVPATPSRFF